MTKLNGFDKNNNEIITLFNRQPLPIKGGWGGGGGPVKGF
jgi:hypothetical protein